MYARSPDKTKDAGRKAAASSDGQDSSDDEDFHTILSKMKMRMDKQLFYLCKLGCIIKIKIEIYAKASHQKAPDDLSKLADEIHTGFNIYEKLDGIIHESLDNLSEMFDVSHKEGMLDGIVKCDSVQQGIEQAGISGVSGDYVKNVFEKDGGLDLNELKQGMEGLGISGVSDDSVKKLFGKDGAMDINEFKQGMESFQTLKNILKQQKEDIVKRMTSALQSGGAITGKMDDTKPKLGGEKK